MTNCIAWDSDGEPILEGIDSTIIPRLDVLEGFDFGKERGAWLDARRTGIGGSEVATVLGLSPWNTPLGLWRQKKGLDPDSKSSWPMTVGSRMELAIAESWAEKNGVRLVRLPFLRDTQNPHRSASLDYIGIWPDGHVEVLEIKWSAKGVDGVPSYYYTQVMWYMAVTGIHKGRLIVADPWHEPEDRPIDWDNEVAGSITNAVDEWWFKYIVGDEEPEPSGSDEEKEVAFDKLTGKSAAVAADSTVSEIVRRLIEAKSRRDSAEDEVKAIDAELATYMAQIGATKIDSGDWTASFVERIGSVKYSEVVKAMGIPKETLEEYRGSSSRFITVRVKGDK